MVKHRLRSGATLYLHPYSKAELEELREMEGRIGLNKDGGGIIRGPRTPPAPTTPNDKQEENAPGDGGA